MCRLPVIPVVGKWAKDMVGQLKRSGFDAIEFGEYTQLNDQLVLAVRTSYANAWSEEDGSSYEEIAQYLADKLGTKAGTTLALCHDSARMVTKAPGFMFFWLMPSAYLSKLTSKVGSIDDWGVAL